MGRIDGLLQMLVKKDGQLRSVSERELFQQNTQVIAHGPLPQEHAGGNLTVAEPFRHQTDELILPVGETVRLLWKNFILLKELWDAGTDLCAEHGLTCLHGPQGGTDAVVVGFQEIPLDSAAEGLDDVLII